MRFLLISLFVLITQSAWAEAAVSLVRVIKGEHKLQLWADDKMLHEFHVVFGGSPQGHKTQEGDKKTPEGRYILDYKKSDSAYYKAIHISYPNAQDIAQAKARGVSPGGQIMIHGQPNGLGWNHLVTQRFNWTNGCVALSNADMDVVWSLVKVGTPIQIQP